MKKYIAILLSMMLSLSCSVTVFASGIEQNIQGSGLDILKAFGIAFIVALIIAFGVCSGYKAQMQTAVKAREANRYVDAKGLKLSVKEDAYIRTTRTERMIQQPTNKDSVKI